MSSKSSLSFVDAAAAAVRVLKTHGQFSSSPHATPSEFIAEATDRRPPSGIIWSRLLVPTGSTFRFISPVNNSLRARALHDHTSSPHFTPHCPISSLIAAFHAHYSSQASKQRPISSAEGRAARFDASGEFTVRDTSLELMRKTDDALDCHLYLSKTSDVSRSSSPRRHHAVALTSLFSFCEQQHGLARQPQQLVLDLGLAFASASSLLLSLASPRPSYRFKHHLQPRFKSPSISLRLASRLPPPSSPPLISSPFASLRPILPHAPQTSSLSPDLSDALPTTPRLPAPSDRYSNIFSSAERPDEVWALVFGSSHHLGTLQSAECFSDFPSAGVSARGLY
ncbi:uncharacterized protein SCHCODRAFT_02582120 [Schizophyllum commune H4-8]|nr:uncharacterized protein SCHCODRAFT_02582120 [Schizophyllum commune H4-8]KAI5889865.1 hypothetical protein SCHCODRAFT_02582120 [Schizophyllum commune H4-8]